jgi:polar amino acid transport system substrate-binding protein
MGTNCLGLLALGILLSGCTSIDTAPTTEEKLALAPTGKLRAAMVITNPVHATKDPSSGELKGVAIDLGKEMARRLGVPFEVVGYSGATALIGSAKSGQWDIVFIGVPVGEMSAPYVQIDLGYLVPKDSPISKISEIDSRGIRIAVQEKGGADTLLTPTIKEATLVRRPTIADAVEAVRSGNADAMAGIKTYLIPTSERLPGSRVLEGRFAVEQNSIGVPKGHHVAAAYVRRFVDAAKSEGLVKAAIERAGIRGLDPAP